MFEIAGLEDFPRKGRVRIHLRDYLGRGSAKLIS
jgi:hypothetical protein